MALRVNVPRIWYGFFESYLARFIDNPQNPGTRPCRGTHDFCDTRLLSTLRSPPDPKWPLMARRLDLGLAPAVH